MYCFYRNESPKAQTELSLIKSQLQQGYLRRHYCRSLAHSLINSLLEQKCTFVKRPEQFECETFITSIAPLNLADKQMSENLFLLEIGKNYHTLVIQKIQEGNKLRFIIYQSWYSTFTLDWWLGSDKVNYKISQDNWNLRETYGKGKLLSTEELFNFLRQITHPQDWNLSTKIGIAGSYISQLQVQRQQNSQNSFNSKRPELSLAL